MQKSGSVRIILWAVLITAFLCGNAFAYGNGVAGRTLKPGSSPGCTCHSGSANTSVVVTITGPSTLQAGQTGTYTFSVSRSSGTFSTGGIDIAVSTGTLGLGGSSGIKLLSGEIVHSSKFSSATTKTFTVTAPTSAGTLTIYATGAGGTNPPAWNHATSLDVTVTPVSGIIENGEIPATFSLSQNYPNPFNPNTNISFAIPKTEFVNLSVYDLSGKLVAELVNGQMQAGNYTSSWSAGNIASGVYFYKITAGDFADVKKLTLIK